MTTLMVISQRRGTGLISLLAGRGGKSLNLQYGQEMNPAQGFGGIMRIGRYSTHISFAVETTFGKEMW